MSLKKKILEIIERYSKVATREAFKTRSWDGIKWKRKKDGSPATLVKSGKMKNSLKWVRNRQSVEVKGVEYAMYHNSGTSVIPQRQFIGIDKATKKKIDKEVKRLIDKELAKLG